MNETANEQLSALMDGELPRDELRFLLRGLDGDAGLARRWSRYHVARAVLQRQYVPAATGDDRFAAAIMLRLEPAPAQQRRLGRRIGRWAGGGAIAAAVAVVALMATRPAGENGALPAAGSDVAALTPMLLAPQQPAAVSQARQQQPVFVPMPAMPATFSDTQPASFESFLPRYTVTPRGPAQNTDATPNGFVPYILMIGSRPKAEVQAAAGQDAPPPPQQ